MNEPQSSPASSGSPTLAFLCSVLLGIALTAAGLAVGAAVCWVAHGATWLFILVVLGLLVADQVTFNKNPHEVGWREAVFQSLFWLALGVGFGLFTYYESGPQKGMEYFTGYFIEKALSVDNLFVFIVIFAFFKVPVENRHKVLFWGIIGAKIMRFALIAAGAAIVSLVHWPLAAVLVSVAFLCLAWYGSFPRHGLVRWLLWSTVATAAGWATATYGGPYLHGVPVLGLEANVVLMFFGVVLLGSCIKLYNAGDDDGIEPEKNPVVQFVKNHFPVHDQYVGSQFFARVKDGAGLVWKLTPLAIVLVAIEATDLMFATDSIPAIFAVSKDPFILYTSNVCAILGLRALYFLLERGMKELVYLKKALVLVLAFIGIKLVGDPFFHIPIEWALAVVLTTIAGSVVLSLVVPGAKAEAQEEQDGENKS